jgi:hypothetical protein
MRSLCIVVRVVSDCRQQHVCRCVQVADVWLHPSVAGMSSWPACVYATVNVCSEYRVWERSVATVGTAVAAAFGWWCMSQLQAALPSAVASMLSKWPLIVFRASCQFVQIYLQN